MLLSGGRMKTVAPGGGIHLREISLGRQSQHSPESSDDVLRMNTRLVLLEDSAEGSLSRLLQMLGVHFEPKASLEEAVYGGNINSNKKSVLILSGQHLNAARALARTRSVSLAQLFGNFAAVLLCAWEGKTENIRCLAEWIGGKVEVTRFQGDAHCYAVKALALAKPFSGLEFGPVKQRAISG